MAIIKLVTKRSNAQRQVIMKRYFDDYNRDLILDLKSELSSELKSIIVNLMYPPLGFLCLELNRALNTLPLITF
ncbi:annexin A8-like [Diaphorina citri]|uniref:Annexin A8-like n=1 Tax=Diaphorina citri TaxID=121845 RepID=A0A3Q0IM97_DIACI|nr:annexin A8-like [Diaphorina citri]